MFIAETETSSGETVTEITCSKVESNWGRCEYTTENPEFCFSHECVFASEVLRVRGLPCVCVCVGSACSFISRGWRFWKGAHMPSRITEGMCVEVRGFFVAGTL